MFQSFGFMRQPEQTSIKEGVSPNEQKQPKKETLKTIAKYTGENP